MTPSAGTTVVLRIADLSEAGRFAGWPVLTVLPDLLVFTRSMVHFAPAHAEALALFDVATGIETSLYPPRPSSPDQTRPDVHYSSFAYEAATDRLTFAVSMSSRQDTVALPVTPRLTVFCSPLKQPTRQCVERPETTPGPLVSWTPTRSADPGTPGLPDPDRYVGRPGSQGRRLGLSRGRSSLSPHSFHEPV